MKVALGIIARPVESLLIQCLTPIMDHFDGLVMLSQGSPEWMGKVSELHPPRVSFFHYVWKNDYAEARNHLIDHAQELGYDWLLMLDADESMLPEDLVVMRKYMEDGHESLIFPRYEFVDDFHHFCPSFYPDYQARAFKLNMGYHYVGKIHEELIKGNDQPARLMGYSTRVPMLPIYHYGKSKPTKETWLKYNTYERIAAGLQPLCACPQDAVIPPSWALENKKVQFLGKKPL